MIYVIRDMCGVPDLTEVRSQVDDGLLIEVGGRIALSGGAGHKHMLTIDNTVYRALRRFSNTLMTDAHKE